MRRGGVLALGLGVTASAIAFGSRPLGVAGIGLVLAALAARLWAELARGRVTVEHRASPSPAVEGDRVLLEVEAARGSGVPVGAAHAAGTLGRLGPYEARLEGRRRRLLGEIDLGRLPRGRFPISRARLVLGDHLGLESVTHELPADGFAIVVHPRLVELGALFSDAGRFGDSGRRLLLRRPAGFDLHSVRAYAQGESLRRVHWPTTARTGQLMVKELEDSLRNTVVVLLDCHPAGLVGESPESSFDDAVRAAGSVLKVYARRRRRAVLATTGRAAAVQPVSGLEGDFDAALAVLAAAEADGQEPVARWLAQARSPAASAGELVVVTANLEPATVDHLLGTAARQLLSVVWVDAPSYARRPTRAATGPLRLVSAGVPVAVHRRGDDLAVSLDLALQAASSNG